MATIYISHGEKGGVGKSVNSMLLVECMLAAGRPVALIEGDPSQPDVGTRYAGDDSVILGALSLNAAGDSENALSRLGGWLETQGESRDVVINLPAGAGQTLDALGDLVAALAGAMGYTLAGVYSLEKNAVAAEAAERSFTGGLMSYIDPANRWIAYPAYKGEVDGFAWFHSPARDRIEIAGEIVVPKLANSSALRKLESTAGRLSELVDKSARPAGWAILDQMSVYRWYSTALECFAPMIVKEEVEA